jgi:hypothetical protein
MVHITEIELKIHFEEDDFVNYLNNAKSEIILRNNNDEIEIEFMGSTINTTVNGYLGNFSKYRIISSGNLLGYLEAFRSNKSEYLLIYTNPK